MTAEFWHKHTTQGFQSRCKQCACEIAREWYANNPERNAINHRNSSGKRTAQRAERRAIKEAAYVAPTHRVCNVCQQELPRTAEFWPKQPRRSDGLDETCKECAKKRARDWCLANKARASAQRKEYRERNPDKVIGRRVKYRAENLEAIRERNVAYYWANAEKRRADVNRYRLENAEKVAAKKAADYLKDPERIKERARKWAKDNPTLVTARQNRRRALEVNAPGHFTGKDILKKFEAQQGKCFYCDEQLEGKGTVDHVMPLSKGGTNYPEKI